LPSPWKRKDESDPACHRPGNVKMKATLPISALQTFGPMLAIALGNLKEQTKHEIIFVH
jgi:hypothetical protein